MTATEEVDEEGGGGKVNADGWLDLMSGKIKKRVLTEGYGKSPDINEDVRCSVDIRVAGDDSEDPCVRYQEIRYRIGEGEAIQMLEIALQRMKEGEEAEVFGMADTAWGASGLKAAGPDEREIPADSTIRLRVKLLEVIPANAEETAWNELIQMVTWRKTNGNDHFKRQDMKKAKQCYTAGIEVFQSRGFEPPDTVREADKPRAKAAAMALVTDVAANLAAVYLEQNDPAKAKETALEALDTRPEHVKCIYRAAKACMMLDQFEQCEDLLKRGFALDPDNAAMQKVDAELKRKQRKYEAKSKRVAECDLFGGLDYPDLVAKKAVQHAQDEYEDTWTYWFKKEVLEVWFSKQIVATVVSCTFLLILSLLLLPTSFLPLYFLCYAVAMPVTIGVLSANAEEDDDRPFKRKKKKA